MSGHLQWKRVVELVVGTGGNAVFIRGLRMKFKVTKTIGRHPNLAEFKVFNMRDDHEAQLGGEFTDVLFNVGYQGSARLVFTGNVRHTFRYPEGTDRITQIDAADGDRDFRMATLNVTLGPGTTDADLVDHIVKNAFKATKRGHVVVSAKKRIRAAVYSGDAATALDGVSHNGDAHWSIQDKALTIVPVNSTLPNEAVVLRSDTGLLSAPEISDKGIKFKCLLNPDIVINGKVWLDNNSLKERILKEREKKPGAKPRNPAKPTKPKRLVRLDPDGIYKVTHLEHTGDTHANEFYTVGVCVALPKTIPAGARAA